MVKNRGKFFRKYFVIFITAVFIFLGLFLGVKNIRALNSINNPFFATDASGWTTATDTTTTDTCGAAGTAASAGMATFAFDGTNGNPAGSFMAISGTSKNARYKSYIRQSITVPGSGTVKIKGRFDYFASATTWRASNVDGHIKLKLYDSTNTTLLANLGCVQLPGNNVAWTTLGFSSDYNATGGTTYVVRATIAYYNSGTNAATIRVDNIIVTVAPTGFAVSAPAGTSNAQLNWTASTAGTGAAGLNATTPYKVYRDTSSPVSTFSANVTTNSHTDTSTLGNTTYYYAVSDVDTNSIESPLSAEASVLTRPAAPGTPTFSNVGETSLRASWTAPTGGATSYKVERCTGSGCSVFSQIASGVTNTFYDDSLLSANTVYRYQIRATNASGDGAYSGIGNTLTLPAAPGTPTFSNVGETSLRASWTAPTGGATSYKVERCAGSGCSVFSQIASGVTTLYYDDSLLSANTVYRYQVRATNASGDGAYSGIGDITTSATPVITTATTGNQTSSFIIPSTNNYVGGAFTFSRSAGSADITQITLTETGTVDAQTNIANVKIYYKTAGTCSYNGTETLFGTGSFNVSSKAAISGTMTVGTSQVCAFIVLDVGSGASDGQTLEIEISNPSTEVAVSAGTVSPATAVAIAGTTNLSTRPVISSISPNNGKLAGGTNVTITGTGFLSGASVTFGGSSATNVVVVSGTSITATTPAHSAGAVDVVVTNIDTQSGTLTNGFSYISGPVITSISPDNGKLAGGTNVAITGGNFQSGATITFNSTPATNVVFVSSTSITATTPSHSAGLVNVTVTNPDMQSYTLTGGYTYNPLPTISSVSPSSGSTSGTNVTITGTGFLSGASVTFGGSSATNVVVVSGTSITASAPAHAVGTVDVTVTNADTQSGTLLNGFSYIGPPTINLTASPTTIFSGESSVLNWTSTDANTCVASGAWSGSKATTGNETVSPTSTSTYTLTCDGTGGTAQSSVSVTVSAQAPTPTPSGANGVQFRFDGLAYADGTVLIYDGGVPIARLITGVDGSFSTIFRVDVIAKHIYSVVAYDKNEQSSPVKTFPSDIYANRYASDILIAPTISLNKRMVSKKGEINVYGYATPKRKVKIDIDGKAETEIVSNETGYYSVMISAAKFSEGSHKIKIKQIDVTGRESDYSILKTFNVSEPFVTAIDLNGDNVLNIADWSIFLSSWASKDVKLRSKIDFNNDGKITIADLSIFLNAFSKKKK